MRQPPPRPCPTGSVYARVLEKVLNGKGHWIGRLNDLGCISNEEARRLSNSYCSQKSFPVLNIDALERVRVTCKLDDDDLIQVRAATLAAAVQRMLMKRLTDEAIVFAATQTIYDAIENAIRRGGPASRVRQGDTTMADEQDPAHLAPALACIDRAVLAVQLSDDVSDHEERVRCLREASESFQEAITLLDKLDRQHKNEETWRYWHHYAEEGRQAAHEALRKIGVR